METPTPKPLPPSPTLWMEFYSVWKLGTSHLLARWWMIPLIVGIGATLVLADRGGWEQMVFLQIRQADHEILTISARWFSKWGDIIGTFILTGILLMMGFVFGSARWRQIAWSCLIAGCLSGLIVNLFRPTMGRSRPSLDVPATFHGPHLKKKGIGFESKYLSFPSGHATCSFAPAAAIAAAVPVVGIPCLIFAGSVSWSRMQLNQHRPLDVMTGAALGTFVGVCFGTAVPRARMRLRWQKTIP